MKNAMTKRLQVDKGIELNIEVYERGKKAWIVVCHGIGEHLGRHQYLVNLFSQYYNLLFFDLRGHGKSSGKRAFVDQFDDYSSDLIKVIKFLKDDYRAEDFVLFGHSMGALVVANSLQNFEVPGPISKVYLSSPPVGLPGVGRITKIISSKWFDKLANLNLSIPLKGLVDKNGLSHNPEVIDLYERDPLNCMALHSKLLLQLANTSKKVFSKSLGYSGELYASVGSGDTVVDPNAAVKYFNEIHPATKFYLGQGARHEIHNEIEKYQKPYFEFLKETLI